MGLTVAVGGAGVFVAVDVGGSDVSVGVGVSVGGMGVLVGGRDVLVAVGGSAVLVAVDVTAANAVIVGEGAGPRRACRIGGTTSQAAMQARMATTSTIRRPLRSEVRNLGNLLSISSASSLFSSAR
jgi:hypothetical protein